MLSRKLYEGLNFAKPPEDLLNLGFCPGGRVVFNIDVIEYPGNIIAVFCLEFFYYHSIDGSGLNGFLKRFLILEADVTITIMIWRQVRVFYSV